VPPNTTIFLLGLAVGTSLLILGLLLGYWLGRKSSPVGDVVDRQQFLTFLQNLSNWTSEFSGDVTKYQTQLTTLNDRMRREQGLASQDESRQEILGLLSQIMQANQQLQSRLDSAEQKLESQTDQISNYLTEARTDGLTGLFNRRAFDKAMDQLYIDWQNKGQSYSLGLIDIDHFKHINDTYGHPAGDAVLQSVAKLLQTELPDVVCVARYGGEEFAMLTKADASSAAQDLDRLRDKISRLEVRHDDRPISVTLSAGAAQIERDDKIGKLVRRADEALYAAKLGGRNRVYLHDGTICHLITNVPSDSMGNTSNHAADGVSEESQAAKQASLAKHARIQERLQRIVEQESRRVLGK
jgi:diguanylate cyclase